MMEFQKVQSFKKAFLFCSLGNFCFMGLIEDEGSFEGLAKAHEKVFNELHRGNYFVIVEDSPTHKEIINYINNNNTIKKIHPNSDEFNTALTKLYRDKINHDKNLMTIGTYCCKCSSCYFLSKLL